MHAVSKTRVEGAGELSIQLDRGRIKYSKMGHHLIIEIEHGIGEISIFCGSIKRWLPPHSDEVIDDLQKQRIIANTSKAMRLLGVDFVLE